MPLWIGTKRIFQAYTGSFFINSSKVMRVYADINQVWKRNDPLPTYDILFSVPGGLTNEEQYPYTVASYNIGSNPLSSYDEVNVGTIGSYYDPSAPPGYEVAWTSTSNTKITSYGTTIKENYFSFNL